MLKFFRKIRRKLVEGGNLKRYLIYALGEILLVVVGILIALQINNWNTQKQENKELQGFIKNISRNIHSDLAELKELRDFRDSTRAFSSNILRLSRADKISKEEFFRGWRWDYNVYVTRYFNVDQSGFEALKSLGYLSKLQGTSLEFKLYDYYNLVAELEMEQGKLNRFLEAMGLSSQEENVIQQLDVLRWETPYYSKDFSKESNVILELIRHPTMTSVNRRNRDQMVVSNLYEKIIPVGEEIISIIQKEWELRR